jgi:hypothetical protein
VAYDPDRQRVVLYGSNSDPVRDTWEWDGATWTQVNPPGNSPRVDWAAMAYDQARKRQVLFGGVTQSAGQPGDPVWFFGSPASSQSVGTACAGANGPVVLACSVPFLGNPSLHLDLLSARATSPCVVVLASGTQNLALGGGCTLYLDGALLPLVTASDQGGFASVQLSVPLDAALRGAVLYAQGFVVDPVGPVAGLVLSAGLRLVLGE